MKALGKANFIIHVLALALWMASLVSAGVTATAVFSKLPDLGVHLDTFSSYQVDDPEAHGRLASGIILERVFTAVDFAQVALGVIVIVTLFIDLFLRRGKMGRFASLLRLLCITTAALLAGYHVVAQAPEMNRHLRAYWDAARRGVIEEAAQHQQAFERYHPRAEAILQINLVLLLGALGATAASGVHNGASSSTSSTGLTQPNGNA